jgi:hypothetical protein
VSLRETFATAGGAGGLRWVTGDPSALGESGSLGELVIDTATGTVYQNTNGATTWTAVGTPSPSVSISKAGITNGVTNLTTVGGLDWYAFNFASLQTPSGLANGQFCKKHGPDWLRSSFKWIPFDGGPFTDGASISTAGSDPQSFSWTDCVTQTVFTQQWTGLTQNTNNEGAGWEFRLPLAPTTRRIRMWTLHFNNTISVECKTTAGATSWSLSDVSAANANGRALWTVDYSGPRGEELRVRTRISGPRVSGANASNIFLGAVAVEAP